MMYDSYEVNEETLALIPVNNEITKVIETDSTFFVNLKSKQIIDDSCRYFGSSYEGRYEGSKNLIGMNYKLPIIIEETREFVFFPTTSPRQVECSWISLNNIVDYGKNGKRAVINFRGNISIELEISYGSLENQIFRATMLLMNLKKRKK